MDLISTTISDPLSPRRSEQCGVMMPEDAILNEAMLQKNNISRPTAAHNRINPQHAPSKPLEYSATQITMHRFEHASSQEELTNFLQLSILFLDRTIEAQKIGPMIHGRIHYLEMKFPQLQITESERESLANALKYRLKVWNKKDALSRQKDENVVWNWIQNNTFVNWHRFLENIHPPIYDKYIVHPQAESRGSKTRI